MSASVLCPRAVALLLLLLCALHCSAGPSQLDEARAALANARAVLTEVISAALQNHCPSVQQQLQHQQRIVDSTRTALKTLFAETFSESSGRPELDPRWRCSCPSGYIPCGGRCYARLHRPVEYPQAERECSLLGDGAHLAVPRSQQQRVCVSGLAGHHNVWLGITDREEEGVFMGADGRPVTGNEVTWSTGQPDNAGGVEHCVSAWIVRDGVRFGEWNDYPCTGVTAFPMCQLP